MMKNGQEHLTFESVMAEVKKMKSKDQRFRLYPQSVSVRELLIQLHNCLSRENLSDERLNAIEHERLIQEIVSSYRLINAAQNREKIFFQLGQIAMLLECLKCRMKEMNKPYHIRLFQ